jgi:hypothetical protein
MQVHTCVYMYVHTPSKYLRQGRHARRRPGVAFLCPRPPRRPQADVVVVLEQDRLYNQLQSALAGRTGAMGRPLQARVPVKNAGGWGCFTRAWKGAEGAAFRLRLRRRIVGKRREGAGGRLSSTGRPVGPAAFPLPCSAPIGCGLAALAEMVRRATTAVKVPCETHNPEPPTP